jgi:hypothetical protein
VLGEEHPNTLTSVSNFALSLKILATRCMLNQSKHIKWKKTPNFSEVVVTDAQRWLVLVGKNLRLETFDTVFNYKYWPSYAVSQTRPRSCVQSQDTGLKHSRKPQTRYWQRNYSLTSDACTSRVAIEVASRHGRFTYGTLQLKRHRGVSKTIRPTRRERCSRTSSLPEQIDVPREGPPPPKKTQVVEKTSGFQSLLCFSNF